MFEIGGFYKAYDIISVIDDIKVAADHGWVLVNVFVLVLTQFFTSSCRDLHKYKGID